ncbi:L-fucose isomerase [Alkalibacter rhizosphaerae]|uniref:FucIase n=1 Tax=Alkalibacter rhizosphaerae TaxID=2815577 RepID=A0A974XD83_9FIRM|nr:L-fucose isomerase [Alkalibacter rhizosphaerae]QSX07697.1 L-fucose isomerase [Alkalibacter rhizosphaerae]
MMQSKVAVMTFGDPREHEWNSFIKNYAIPRHKQAVEYLKSRSIDVIYNEELPRSNAEIDLQIEEMKKKNPEVFIAHVSTWAWPSMVVRAVQTMNLPTILLGNDHPGTASLVGFFGSGGALNQIGYPHLRVCSEFSDEDDNDMDKQILPYVRSASAVSRLKGGVMGFFGGRSLGIDTGSFDSMQWRSQFGIDADHIDQLEIIRQSELIDENRTVKMREWLLGNVKSVKYNEKLTSEKLDFQIRCYLATKDIIEERGLDFVAIKCMPDLSNHYVPQCLSAAFLPSPFDAEGPKNPVSMACEADADGALSMEILKHVSGGNPPMFGDVSAIDKENSMFYIPNCGAICSWYATRKDSAEDNLKEIELRPANRPAGGAIPFMPVAPGEITLARLYRKSGKYHMAIIPGQVVKPNDEIYENYKKARGEHVLPTAFVKLSIDFERFIGEFGSNHISGVAGIWTEELELVCEMLDITPVKF